MNVRMFIWKDIMVWMDSILLKMLVTQHWTREIKSNKKVQYINFFLKAIIYNCPWIIKHNEWRHHYILPKFCFPPASAIALVKNMILFTKFEIKTSYLNTNRLLYWQTNLFILQVSFCPKKYQKWNIIALLILWLNVAIFATWYCNVKFNRLKYRTCTLLCECDRCSIWSLDGIYVRR